MSNSLRADLLVELRQFPSGSPAQELFRLAYSQARLRGIDRNSIRPASPEVARDFALDWVRQRYPGFVPVVSKGHDPHSVVPDEGALGAGAAK
jgi:hypothetical protein